MNVSECINVNVFIRDAPLKINSVNVFDLVNVCVDARHSLIIIPLDISKPQNVKLSYVSNVITVAVTPSKEFSPYVGDVLP